MVVSKYLCVVVALTTGLSANGVYAQPTQPVVIPSAKVADGSAFSHPDATRGMDEGVTHAQHVFGISPDRRMIASIYDSGASKIDFATGYPGDEFMYFITGGVTLTDTEGKVTKVSEGEAVFLPKGWKGTWDSPAYKKYFVYYSDQPME